MNAEDSNEVLTRTSSTSEDLISRIDIAEVNESGSYHYQSLTTSAVLAHCKHKILRPYLRLLAVIGLRGFGTDRPDGSKFLTIAGYIHLSQVVLFIIVGYVLQYMACFRRDRGFCYRLLPLSEVQLQDHVEICYGSLWYSYIIPSLLHFGAFLYALYLLRFKETEELENLMERTCLLSIHRISGPQKQHSLVRNLWLFIGASFVWMSVSLVSVIFMLCKGDVIIQWLTSDTYKIFLEVILIISTLCHDVVQATIITSYCLQVQLLSSSLYFLKDKLLQHTIKPLSWIREIKECQNFINYLNNDLAPIVGVFTLLNISWAISGVLWLLKLDTVDTETKPIEVISIVIVVLWVIAALAPFVMSAWLTAACDMLKGLGHEVRVRPFVYQDTPGEDLDTILLYTSTLRMKSKLFHIPITGNSLFFCLAVSVILLLTLGQCHLL